MNSFQAHIFNVFVLIVFGLWGPLDSYDQAGTSMQYKSLIAPAAGLFLLVLSPWIAKQRNRSMIIAASVILLLLVYFYLEFMKTDGEPRLRIIVQALSNVWALILLIKNLFTNTFRKPQPTETELPL